MSVSTQVVPSVLRARGLRVAIFSTYPPRACGIGTFSFDVRSALLDLPGIDDVSSVVVVDELSCELVEQPELLATARAEARRIGSRLTWPSVASATAAVLREAVARAPAVNSARAECTRSARIEQRLFSSAATVQPR